MRDKALDTFLTVLFSIGGITILTLAWAQPMPVPESILTTLIGSIGLFWVLIRIPLLLMSMLAKTGIKKVSQEVEVNKKPY